MKTYVKSISIQIVHTSPLGVTVKKNPRTTIMLHISTSHISSIRFLCIQLGRLWINVSVKLNKWIKKTNSCLVSYVKISMKTVDSRHKAEQLLFPLNILSLQACNHTWAQNVQCSCLQCEVPIDYRVCIASPLINRFEKFFFSAHQIINIYIFFAAQL